MNLKFRDADMPKWTQDQAIAFEAARECITDMMGICSAAIAAEESCAHPDPARLADLEAELTRLAAERAVLTVLDEERVAAVRGTYGPRIRAHRAAQRDRAAA